MITDDPEPPDPLLEALAATPAGEVLTRSTVLDGQYKIERVIGEGGMGVVYRAHDLRLDRDVAIKVSLGRSTLAQLSREAIVLARLSHPNVVVIYQVGELDGRPYVVMEYVPGGTARQWAANRSANEILALYIAAGRGLAAAHAVGLVHGDVKPDNILVGADGRPRVADFGIARPSLTNAEASGLPQVTGHHTNAGAGTAAYMAPEQLARRVVDSRADQFAYCVCLWEALFGARPFESRTAEPESHVIVERSSSSVPKHVSHALRRGLAFAPADRWPSLEPLLAELEREGPRSPKATIALGVELIAVVTAVAGLLGGHGASDEDPCAQGAVIDWSPTRATALHANIAPAGARPWLVQSAARATTTLDGWTQTWSNRYRAVCTSSRTWSADLITRGYACLEQRKREFAAVVDVLASTPGVGGHADAMLEKLISADVCGDAEYLASAVAPPATPGLAAEVSRVRDSLAKVDALVSAAQVEKAKTTLDAIVVQARAVDYPPLHARIVLAQGLVSAYGEDAAAAFPQLHEAYFVARESHDEETAAVSAANAALSLLNLSRDSEAADWARLASVDATAAASRTAEMSAASALASVAYEHGDPKTALEDAETYVRLARTHEPKQRFAEALRIRAKAHDRLGAYPAALADLDEAESVLRAAYGEHPRLVELVSERALVLLHVDRPDDAVTAARSALELATRLAGDESSIANTAVATLATTLKSAKRAAEALPLFDRTTAFDRAHGGDRSYNVASDLNDHADTLSSLDRIDEALALWKEAVDIFREIEGAEGYDVALVEFNIWNGLYGAKRPLDGAPHLARAFPILAKTPKTQVYAQALVGTALVDVEKRDFDHARDHANEGLGLLGADDHVQRMRAKLVLARIALAKGDRAAAQPLLAAAMVEAKAAEPRDVREVEDWMKR